MFWGGAPPYASNAAFSLLVVDMECSRGILRGRSGVNEVVAIEYSS